jgi:hypothetical protein
MRTLVFILVTVVSAPCLAQSVAPPPGVSATDWSQIRTQIQERYGSPVLGIGCVESGEVRAQSKSQQCDGVIARPDQGRPGKCFRLRLQRGAQGWLLGEAGRVFDCF